MYRDAFPVRDQWLTGPNQLLATDDGCFLGVGTDSVANGMVPAVWTATGDCSAVTLDRADPGDARLRGNVSSLTSAVLTDNGAFLAVGHIAAGGKAFREGMHETFAVHGKPGAWWPPVTTFQAMTAVKPELVGPHALIERPGGGFLAIGQSGADLFAWTTDDGVSWSKSPLAVPAGMKNVEVVSAASSPDGTIAIVGMKTKDPLIFQSQALAWYSTDRGSSWRLATVPADQGARPTALLHNGKRFIALGMVWSTDELSRAYALTSSDGITWHRDPALEPSAAAGFHAAALLADGRIAATSVGSLTPASSATPAVLPPHRGCPSVFFLGGPVAIEEHLGCNGIPDAMVQLNDGRIAAVMAQHLWLREPINRP